MSDQVSILVGQNRTVVGRFFKLIIILSGSLFEIIISHHFTYCLVKNLSGHNVRPKLRFRRTWADFSWTLSDDLQLFAAL